MEIICQKCKTSHHLSDSMIPLETKIVRCKQCNAAIVILGKNSLDTVTEEKSLVAITETPPANLTESEKNLIPSEQEETKKCDFCGEKILAIAKKCKHCGETLDVVLRAAEEARRANNTPNVFMNAGGSEASAAVATAVTVKKEEENSAAGCFWLIVIAIILGAIFGGN